MLSGRIKEQVQNGLKRIQKCGLSRRGAYLPHGRIWVAFVCRDDSTIRLALNLSVTGLTDAATLAQLVSSQKELRPSGLVTPRCSRRSPTLRLLSARPCRCAQCVGLPPCLKCLSFLLALYGSRVPLVQLLPRMSKGVSGARQISDRARRGCKNRAMRRDICSSPFLRLSLIVGSTTVSDFSEQI